MRKIGIYSFTNKLNGKKYIGSSDDLDRRWNDHFTLFIRGDHPNSYMQRSVDKHGIDIFEIEWMLKCPEEELLYWEDHYIDLFDSMNSGYNLISADRREWSKETKKKLSKMFSGEGNPFFGRRHTEETKKQISDKNKGRKMSEEQRLKMIKAVTGLKRSDEAKRNISKGRTGIKIGPLSKEHKKQISERHRGEGNNMSVLKEKEIIRIRLLYEKGFRISDISALFNSSHSAVSHIVKRRTWRHI